MGDNIKEILAKMLKPGFSKVSQEERSQALAKMTNPECLDFIKGLFACSDNDLQNTERQKIDSVKELLKDLCFPYAEAKTKFLDVDFENIGSINVHKSALSPNKLHHRFSNSEDQNGNIRMMKAQAYESIKTGISENFLPKIDAGEGGNYILYGPIGIGKSFGLAMLVMQLRKLPNYLIIYINNASASTYNYLIKEFCYALQFIDIDNLPDKVCSKLHKKITYRQRADDLGDIWDEILEEKNPSTQIDNLWKLVQWFSVIHERLVFIFDQAFSASNKGGLKAFMDKLLEGSNENLTTILCSSRSPPKSMIPQAFLNECILKINAKFTKEQTEEFIIDRFPHLPADDILHHELREQVFQQLSSFTNQIPYELAVACKIARDTDIVNEISVQSLNDLCAEYMRVRKQEIEKIHQEFQTKAEDNQAWIKYLTLTRLKCRITKELQGSYDENFCCLKAEKDENDLQYYVLDFYHPLYEPWAFDYYFTEINACRELLLNSSSLKYEKHPSARGTALEAYCVDKFSSLSMAHYQSMNQWKFRPYNSDRNPVSSHSFSFTMENASNFRVNDHNLAKSIFEYVSPFIKQGKEQPSKSKLDFKGKLFIPDSPYMKCFDAVFVDPEELKIFLIQITTNIKTHKSSDIIFFDLLKESQKNVPLLKNAQEIDDEYLKKYKDALYTFIQDIRVTYKLKFFSFQWIWLGSIDGRFETKISGLTKVLAKESWVVLINDINDKVLEGVKRLFGF